MLVWLVKDELETLWEKTIVAYLTKNFPGGNEYNRIKIGERSLSEPDAPKP